VAVTATFSQMEFARRLDLDYPLLSDWEGTVAAAYRVRYATWKGHSGLAKRSVFIIDRNRRITFRWHTEDALVEPDYAELLAAVTAAAQG
jgi:peroxiredoxin